jgi:hypothetical protein
MHWRRSRLLGLVAPALLVVVALLALWRTTVHDQSSWSGAGFGMFATVDGEATRQVRAHVAETGEVVLLPSGLEREVLEVTVLPTEERMRHLGEAWRRRAGLGSDEVLVVEVWAVEFDVTTAALSRSLLSVVRVEA